MSLREAIVREMRCGNLKQPWTTMDLLNNESLTRDFASATLRTEPPNCSRSADGLALGDGEHSEDYFFYVRVGYAPTGRAGKRPLLYVVREEALAEFHVETGAASPHMPTNDSDPARQTDRHASPMLSAQCVSQILDALHCNAVPLVLHVKHAHAAGTLTGPDAWYQASYPALVSAGPPKSVPDFIRVIAHAYSWLPTNKPAAHPTNALFAALGREVARHKPTDVRRRRLIVATQNAINVTGHAVVTVSKVLHFWDPKLAPMYDVNIKKALASLPCTQLEKWLAPGNEVDKYLRYWTLADRLINAAKKHPISPAELGALDYRLLDELLFQLGKLSTPVPSPGAGTSSGPAKKRRGKPSPRQGATNVKKIDVARDIFASARGQPRRVVVGRFMREAGLSKAGASTYYQSLRTQSRKASSERPVGRGKH